MSGTVRGGKLAASTNKAKYGKDFYVRIGALGGALGTTGGFAANRELAREAGQKGGFASRRVWTDAQKQAYSEFMKAHWAERKETLFVADTTEFGEGFGQPSKMRQLIERMMK